jgi:hypothetical protein
VRYTPPASSLQCYTSDFRALVLLFHGHRALFITQDTHQQQLLCAELLQLPAERINRYLLEYVYLAVSRPSGPIERAITELCGRSFNTAVQVYHSSADVQVVAVGLG